MTNRQCTKKFGKYHLTSQFDGGNAYDFKETESSDVFEIYPAADAQGFSLFLRMFPFISIFGLAICLRLTRMHGIQVLVGILVPRVS
jgi:hypothetical protein